MNARDTSPTRGHLNAGATPPVPRLAPPDDLAEVVRHFWVPEWDLPDGVTVTAHILGYPSLNLVVETTRVLVVGPSRGAGEQVLSGRGWAVGALLQPAATRALEHVLGLSGTDVVEHRSTIEEPALLADVAAVMAGSGEPRLREATARLASWLRDNLTPLTAAGLLANRAVALVESDPTVTQVGTLADRLGVAPRTLQRAVRSGTGFTPAELVRRRRLHEATDRLVHDPEIALSEVAQEAGFADQAHMTREFRRALRATPHRFRTDGAGATGAPHPGG